jgi:hypothetical protein
MKDPKAARADQLAKALRDNLRRRKAQARSRDATSEADSAQQPDQPGDPDSTNE